MDLSSILLSSALYSLKYFALNRSADSNLRHFFTFFTLTGTFSEDVMRKIVLVLSHLIGRRIVHRSLMHRTPSSSKVGVILPILLLLKILRYETRPGAAHLENKSSVGELITCVTVKVMLCEELYFIPALATRRIGAAWRSAVS